MLKFWGLQIAGVRCFLLALGEILAKIAISRYSLEICAVCDFIKNR